MRILWISPFLLHPTEKGGQIRSLGILKNLHARHEVHFAAMQLDGQDSGVARTPEYCTKAYLIPHRLPSRRSPAFVPQLIRNVFSALPLTVERDDLPPMRRLIDERMGTGNFDVTICDFLSSAINVSAPEKTVLFQHNVETVIWERLAKQAPTAIHKWYFRGQAARMAAFEKRICRAAKHVIAVSQTDARSMRELFGCERVTVVATGVDLDYFERPNSSQAVADLAFTGSMDWMPNIDGMLWFTREVLPLIRRRRPDCRLAIVGRTPTPEIQNLAADPLITVTGTVPDVRPYLWGSRVAIVPLRVGGGTRLKIYEAMAAGIPQVSTTIGAEGLTANPGQDIDLADDAEGFAERCLALLEDQSLHAQRSAAALALVRAKFSWSEVTQAFEKVLEAAREKPVTSGSKSST